MLATSDRDAFALIDNTTRVLRLINGGVGASPMLTPERLKLLTGVTPQQYRDLAALRGDPSDNLPGIRGIGKVVGARLLAEFGSGQALFDDLDAGGERCRACAGPAITARLSTDEARERWEFNRRVMTPRPDVTVDTEVLETCIPLSADPIRQGFRAYELGTRTALSVLCGEDPSTPQPADSDPSWQPTRQFVRRFPPLPRKEPVLQETLF
ncbi:5'-3' exonuclease H3TH domain-containing protein [Ammonicoccus fulvus]|uniref:5'-3' exonuclease H3TH domain-containing protein n=1 Tax=Ammonicoccus fulvus TaxID=3138240 RepID=A0ABZ3FIF8_9ACTN